MAAETITIADRARDVLARFGPPPPEHTVDRAERVAWAVARFDGGDHDGAAEELTALLDGWLPESFATAAPRILTGERAVQFATAALGGDHPYRPFVSGRNTPEYAVAGTLARLVAGHADAEEALLRTVLRVRPGEHLSAHLRAARISAAFAALAEAHAGTPELLDGWAALLDENDRPRLAAAAALLGPLGLAETDQRCGAVEDVDGERLVVAFARADRFDDALALATRLGPTEQQRSLLALATPGLPAARAKALVAAFRKCPKRSRERDDQMVYQHRLARLFLALDRIDDALAVLGRMRDCRISGYGPAPLAREVLRWLDGRRTEATSERLRAVLDVLAGDRVIPQELASVVVDAVPLAHALADEPLRAEIVEVRVPRLRARLRVLRWWQLADAGLAAALVDAGDRTAADRLFAEAAGGRPGPQLSRLLARLAVRTGLPARDRDLFAGLLTGVFAEGRWSVEAVLPVLDADALAAVPAAAVAAASEHHDRVVVAVARFAERTGDLDLLGAMLDAAPDAQSASLAAGRAAMALARRGDLRDAVDVARRCGLAAGG
ncbi:hypothetical protein KZZ52_17385 [Dactylosporangium sp. AC04546]|uniref:hypothetical protein n=1 Tax=Dactylosporangium sp. AC04546 TaxID=2862460 RepID=UPI001EDCE57B|nr:hypothetical protein [Dactylosporangium sp. AC04546]WVK87072.1 hypothetical protein KZZ52_17385 [Dactylosporangium sp. AC04546]